MLRSAGITTRVIGDGSGLPARVQACLGWAVREATTNILRHADPTMVTIDLSTVPNGQTGSAARLRIENDGVRELEAGTQLDGHGHGLAGLHQRLVQLGGGLTLATTPAGHFILDVRLPLTQPLTTPDSEAGA